MAKSIAYGLIFLTATSCWLGSLMVKNLDTLISVKVSNSLELFYKQKVKLDQDIDNFLKEKKSLAGLAKKKIQEYQKSISKKSWTPAKIEKEVIYWQNLYTDIALEVIEKHIHYLANLTPSQQQGYFKNFEKRNKEIELELKDDVLEKQIKKFERIFGDLNSEMISVLKSHKDFFKERLEAYLVRRNAFKERLRELYENKSDIAQFKKLASNYINERFDLKTTKTYSKMIYDLVQNLKEEQKEELEKNFNKYETWINVFESTEY